VTSRRRYTDRAAGRLPRRSGPWTSLNQRAWRRRKNIKLAATGLAAFLAVFGGGMAMTWRPNLAGADSPRVTLPAAPDPSPQIGTDDGSPAGRPANGDIVIGSSSFECTVSSVTDGDTFRCAETGGDGRQIRVRVAGVAARERDGTCAPGHPCPSASAEAATNEMERLVAGQVLNCRANGTTYGRIAAFCQRRDGVDVNCAMVASGTALRWERYWNGHRCR
jgi:endonuclease YncB( thermonuclease family)